MTVPGEREEHFYSEGRLSARHTLITLKLCVVLLKQHKNPKPQTWEVGWQSLDQVRRGLGQEGAWERMSTGVGDLGGLRVGVLASPIAAPALPASSLQPPCSQCHLVLPSWAQFNPRRFRFGGGAVTHTERCSHGLTGTGTRA